jgi:hypothetical protein
VQRTLTTSEKGRKEGPAPRRGTNNQSMLCSAGLWPGGIGYGVLEANRARRCVGAFPYVTHADFVVKGMGMQSCASWTDARSKARLGSDTLLRLSWVLGFVSAENQRLSVSAPKKVKSFDIAKGLDLALKDRRGSERFRLKYGTSHISTPLAVLPRR